MQWHVWLPQLLKQEKLKMKNSPLQLFKNGENNLAWRGSLPSPLEEYRVILVYPYNYPIGFIKVFMEPFDKIPKECLDEDFSLKIPPECIKKLDDIGALSYYYLSALLIATINENLDKIER